MTKCKKCGASISDDTKICPSCGAKLGGSKVPLVIGVIAGIVIAGIAFVAVQKKNKLNEPQVVATVVREQPEAPVIQEEANAGEKRNEEISTKGEVSASTDVLPENIRNLLEKTLSSGDDSIITEVTFATDENGDIISLRDIINENASISGEVAVNTTTRDGTGKARSKRRSRGAPQRESYNDSLEDTLRNVDELKDTELVLPDIFDFTERLVGKIFFGYGSFLDMGNMSVEIEKYLVLTKLDADRQEYAAVMLGLNDLISKIPAEKRDVAVFAVMGYADTTLYNGVPEVSKRSEKFNTELSLKRAESVKKLLTESDFGISPDKVVTYGYGYSKNIKETKNLERYRRVDVVVSY